MRLPRRGGDRGDRGDLPVARVCVMQLVAFLLSLGAALVSVPVAGKSAVAGPWWGYPTRQLERPPEITFPMKINMTFDFLTFPHTPKELQRINGVFEMKDTYLDDTLHGQATFDSFTRGRWKDNAIAPMKFPRGACSALRLLMPDFFTKMFKRPANTKERCSLPPGRYEIKNTPVNWTYPPIPYFFYGHYRFSLTAGKGKEDFTWLGAEFKIFPKAKNAK